MKLEYRISRWLAAVAALAIGGCYANRYEIEMTPTGENIQRELTCWRERSSDSNSVVVAFPLDELARIAAAYDASATGNPASKHKFIKAFTSAMPDDVGGSGSYTHWDTSLGSVSAYVERVRGNDDLLADVEQRQEAADRIADLLTGWLASELEGEAGFAELREFMEHRFRRDLKNLSLYSWASGIVSDDEDAAKSAWLVRAGQYLVERSYFTPDELPALTRAVQAIRGDGSARLLALVQRCTASRMGIAEDQPIPASLQFLSDAALAEASFNEYHRQTDEFQHALEEWNRERATNPEVVKPEPNAVFGELVTQAFMPNFQLGRSDRLSVKLAVAAEPFQTNGQWDERAKQVLWSHDIQSGATGFPTLLYAVWSDPDGQAQKARFGRLVIEGGALGRYCLWHRSLSTQEVNEWDEFVSSLRPSDDLTERLRSFRFSHEPPAGEGNAAGGDLAETPREMILRGLTGDGAAK